MMRIYNGVLDSFDHYTIVLCFKHDNMSSLLSLLVLTFIVVTISHPIQIRKRETNISNVPSVCKILWYLNDTIQYCRGGKACNTPALKIISAAIQTELKEWLNKVSWSQMIV